MVNESDEEAELVRQSRVLREEMTEQLKQTLITAVADMIKTSITGLRDELRQELRQATGSRRRQRRDHDERRNQRDDFNGLKIKIPPFHGKVDPDAYLEWEKKIELVFNCKHYSNTQRIQIAATEFHDYALSWWDQLLRRLTQGSKTVEEYYQELELLMLRASISEDREATMARFLGGLNREIQDNVEMQHYVEIEEMLHKAILVEQQLKRKGHSRGSYGSTRFQHSKEDKPSFQKENKPQPKEESKPISIYDKAKGKVEASSSRARDVKCFKCQGRGHYANECTNKRVMVLLDNGEYESAAEEEQTEDKSDEEHEEEPVHGRLLVARRNLSLQTKTEELEQRKNLFYTRCLVQGKFCSLIVDGGSCVNIASETMVQKLGLQVQKHPKPYRLQWLNDEGEMRVSTQVLVPLSIGKYEDEIMCDILPMEASHILLGRPWQYDRRVNHDGFTNKHSFEFKGRKTVLVPLSPKEVHQDQLQLQKKKEDNLKSTQTEPQHNFYAKTGLPPIRGIEHQIDFVPGSTLPNRPAYRTNPVETKELQRQVDELMEKGHIRETKA
ncbi:uncharacterized protein LOC130502047 [Raphanus sativus]|uniref:Uncharacterized protein LOC130502047 n=1 Tax=Raphanus sativus TaxID=3726 RepID=A0A9W3CNE8_RAPSA|nr:uncharacterized protein LOC130502047 [Raphanus sativus]